MAHMFPGASNVAILGGTFISQPQLEKPAFDKLSAAAAYSALHDAPARTDESRCHQHTRTNVLDSLERWAQGICDEGASIFWLYGGAGAGKSAVMQTLAERCVAQGLALGSFFFSRSDPTRNIAEVLIPTLVYQLAQLFPSSMDFLCPIIDRDPLIFKKSFKVQLLNLFIPVLQHLVQLGFISDAPQSPRVFIIDGLDECSDPAQQQAIIGAVAVVCHEHGVPVKYLIGSRPEHAISASFRWYKQENHVLGAISLSEDADAEADIHRFIEDEFRKIRTLHPFNRMIPSEWPALYNVNRLVWKASSHFIYASTAMRYIWSTKENPVRSLQVVLGLEVTRTISPFSQLDALYHHILGSAAHLDKVLQIIAHCVFTNLPSSAGMVCAVLDCSKDDLSIFMADVTPLVALSKPAFMDEEEVTLLHASLEDFLSDQSRSASLYLNEGVYLSSKLERYFQLLNLDNHQQRSEHDWLSPSNPVDLPYYQLQAQIVTTIKKSGHLAATHEVLKQYSLRNLHEWEQRFWGIYPELPHVLYHLIEFFRTVYAIKTSDGLMLFPNYVEDFSEILELYINLRSTPLGPAILPLIFSGYPANVVYMIHSYHSRDNELYWLMLMAESLMDVVTTSDLASIRHSVNTSPEYLAKAAEAILVFMIDEAKILCSSRCSTHKTWLQRTKPGKHVAMGAPRLALAIHAQCDRALRPENLAFARRSRNKVLSSNLRSLPTASRQKYQDLFLDALLWLLPKASFSEKILLYSNRILPWNMYQHNVGLIRRVRKCLDEYSARVQNAKLEELGRRIKNCDVNAVIEKSHMFFLNAQD